ncbi:sensor histidine kinase [Luteococcus sp. Sow4_B9]|uniref:sensor histidine kinase n=1 Tax=Luteococcus sp. Sow4_B9 TaxID=3438792 RepID=UPI003F9CF9A6
MQREDVERRLGRLRIAVLVLPLLFISVFPMLWPSRLHLLFSLVGGLAVVAFGLAVHAQVERGYRHMLALQERAVAAERHSAVLEERDRIAREMHDSLAQVLSVAHLKLRTIQARPELAEHDRVRDELGDLADLCRESCRDVRESILGLRESGREGGDFVEGLEHYLTRWSRSSGIPARLEVVEPLQSELSPAHEVQLSRVVQEALTNVRKHSGASEAVVKVHGNAEGTVLAVVDDGIGFDATTSGDAERYGLHTMRERVEQLGGTFRIQSARGGGTRVEAHLPVAGETALSHLARGA